MNLTVTENSAAPAHDGVDMKKILEDIIENLETFWLKLEAVPKLPKNKKSHSIKLIIKDEFPHLFYENNLESLENCPRSEQIEKLNHRARILCECYEELSAKSRREIDNIKSLYDPVEYDILVTRNTQKALEPNSAAKKVWLDLLEEVNTAKKRNPKIVQQNDTDETKKTEKSANLFDENKENEANKAIENLKAPKKRKLDSLQQETAKKINTSEYPKFVSTYVVIGPNGTMIQKKDYDGLHIKGASGAIRLLCDIIFGDEILGTHTLTGNPSPAFRGRERPPKQQLDPLKVADITHLVCSKFNVRKQIVRCTLTTKCADTTKKLRRIAAKTM